MAVQCDLYSQTAQSTSYSQELPSITVSINSGYLSEAVFSAVWVESALLGDASLWDCILDAGDGTLFSCSLSACSAIPSQEGVGQPTYLEAGSLEKPL